MQYRVRASVRAGTRTCGTCGACRSARACASARTHVYPVCCNQEGTCIALQSLSFVVLFNNSYYIHDESSFVDMSSVAGGRRCTLV